MPKIVDHETRREEIAEALWRVVRRDGIRAASVRTIAAEAGWSAGAVRYYFPDQAGLLSFAMDLVSRRVTERITALEPRRAVRPRSHCATSRRHCRSTPSGAPSSTSGWPSWPRPRPSRTAAACTNTSTRCTTDCVRLCESLLHALSESGALRDDLELRREIERLHALIDGLALHAAIQPDRTTPARVRQLLRHHLETLLA